MILCGKSIVQTWAFRIPVTLYVIFFSFPLPFLSTSIPLKKTIPTFLSKLAFPSPLGFPSLFSTVLALSSLQNCSGGSVLACALSFSVFFFFLYALFFESFSFSLVSMLRIMFVSLVWKSWLERRDCTALVLFVFLFPFSFWLNANRFCLFWILLFRFISRFISILVESREEDW